MLRNGLILPGFVQHWLSNNKKWLSLLKIDFYIFKMAATLTEIYMKLDEIFEF